MEEEELLSFQLHDVAVRKGAILIVGFLGIFYARYSTLTHLPLLRFHCVGGCWN
jgi:hypothetical protein